jgi:hypothetical protein
MIALFEVKDTGAVMKLCPDCKSMVYEIRGAVLVCDCYGRHAAEQNVVNLVMRAQLGVMREPIFRQAA